jgi:predicted DNA-binding transcriptional regulator AlpA
MTNPTFSSPALGSTANVASGLFDPLLTAREGAALIPCSLPTWWRWVANGTLPPAVKLGGMSRWQQSEILAVIEKAKAARTAA